jgi:hypothetical protein
MYSRISLQKRVPRREIFDPVAQETKGRGLLSGQPITVDGTLTGAWANRSSFQEEKLQTERGTGSRGRCAFGDTQQSRSDPEARLYEKK